MLQANHRTILHYLAAGAPDLVAQADQLIELLCKRSSRGSHKNPAAWVTFEDIRGRTPLHYAAQVLSSSLLLGKLLLLLGKGRAFRVTCSTNVYFTNVGAQMGGIDLVSALLKHLPKDSKAMSLLDNTHMTPLLLASTHGHSVVADVLLSQATPHNVRVRRTCDERSILLAINHQQVLVVAWLLAHCEQSALTGVNTKGERFEIVAE
jgi:ankyrin repeat protein